MCSLTVVALAVAAIWLCAYAASRFDRYDQHDTDTPERPE
jgi:hypothetical protein